MMAFLSSSNSEETSRRLSSLETKVNNLEVSGNMLLNGHNSMTNDLKLIKEELSLMDSSIKANAVRSKRSLFLVRLTHLAIINHEQVQRRMYSAIFSILASIYTIALLGTDEEKEIASILNLPSTVSSLLISIGITIVIFIACFNFWNKISPDNKSKEIFNMIYEENGSKDNGD